MSKLSLENINNLSSKNYAIPDDMCKEWQDIFDVMAQGENAITLEQLAQILKTMGHVIFASELRNLVGGVDEMVTFTDFIDIMAYRGKLQDYENELKMAFRSFDHERDGFLYGDVFKHILLNMGDKMRPGQVREVMHLFDIADDDDEEVEYDDIIYAMLQKVTFEEV